MLGVGAFGVVHEELTGRASVPLLVVYASLLGVPGAAALLSLARTGSESSSPQPEESAPPSSRP